MGRIGLHYQGRRENQGGKDEAQRYSGANSLEGCHHLRLVERSHADFQFTLVECIQGAVQTAGQLLGELAGLQGSCQ